MPWIMSNSFLLEFPKTFLCLLQVKPVGSFVIFSMQNIITPKPCNIQMKSDEKNRGGKAIFYFYFYCCEKKNNLF